jgi:hypothetical protein
VRFFLLLGLLLFTTLLGEDNLTQESNTTQVEYKQKVIYLSYTEIPSRILQGEVFSLTIKALSTLDTTPELSYELSDLQGLSLLNEAPTREQQGRYFYDTFYFVATDKTASLPDFTAFIQSDGTHEYASTTLKGQALNVVALNPKKDFSNIIADSFEVIEYKTTSYDASHNIIVFRADASRCDIASFHLKNVFKQGIESIVASPFESKLTYYAIIDKSLENLNFSYFNLHRNTFLNIALPIIVNDDSVTTQSDLTPKDASREILKVIAASIIVVGGVILLLWRKKYIYIVFVIFPLAYIGYILVPSKEICVKESANIYLLPMEHGTIFEQTQQRSFLQKEGSTKEFVKVKLDNEKIGWIKNEDICTY